MPNLPKGKKKKWIASSKAKTKTSNKSTTLNADFYNSRAWRNLRKYHIQQYPVCKWCKEEGKLTIEKLIVDHIIEINDGGDMLNQDNLQTLCLSHHNQKTIWNKRKRNKGD